MTIIQRLVKNCAPRIATINTLVIHKTESNNAAGTLAWFDDEKSQVSSHYVIDLDGTIYMCVPDRMVAWHAGVSSLFGLSEVNHFSIGIELVGMDADEITDQQNEALLELCEQKCYDFKIPLHRVVGHCHIAEPFGRKTDPGPKFPWFDFLNVLGARVSEMEIKGA